MHKGGKSEATAASHKDNLLNVTYRNHEYTTYPSKLAEFLFRSLGFEEGQKLLDVGAGRGEFSRGFSEQGLQVVGVDQSAPAIKESAGLRFEVADLERPLPFADSTFDVIFNKSVIEHFYFPENLVHEMFRVLKPGGRIISLTPSWVHNVKNFHIDFTHRTPFTKESLADIHLIAGFDDVQVDYFIQLPRVWRFPILRYGSVILGAISPLTLARFSKTIRFSKEWMLIATAKRPMEG
jgi:SAM-dependent methyltransferase